MKLVKLSLDHYIIVDESKQPVEGYYYDNFIKKIRKTSGAEYGQADHCWQITHSTQPLEHICCTPEGQIKRYVDCKGCDRSSLGYNKIQQLSLSEVKELLGEVDVEKKAEEKYLMEEMSPFTSERKRSFIEGYNQVQRMSFIEGYNQALEDNKDRKYTEEDMRKSYRRGTEVWMQNADGQQALFYDFLQSLQPTSWDVEFVNGKLKLL